MLQGGGGVGRGVSEVTLPRSKTQIFCEWLIERGLPGGTCKGMREVRRQAEVRVQLTSNCGLIPQGAVGCE